MSFMFVPLWLFDQKGGFSVNADKIALIQVREIPDSNPIKYGYEVVFDNGKGYILPGLYFEDREQAVSNLEQLTNGLFQRFQLAMINSFATSIYSAMKKLETDEVAEEEVVDEPEVASEAKEDSES